VNANMAAFNPPEPFLEVEFEEATKYVRGKVAASGSQEDLLYLYARFKQAKEGECTVAKPSFYQLTEKSKWNAWKELTGMGRAEAMTQYIEKVSDLQPSWRDEVVVEPTEGWVSVSSPVREKESEEVTLWDLVKEGSLEKLTVVLDNLQNQVGAQLSEKVELFRLVDPDGLTLLHWAADRGQVEMAVLLLDRDPLLLDAVDGEGQTALHYAASCSHVDLVTLLLEKGADRTVKDGDGLTPCNSETEAHIKKLFE